MKNPSMKISPYEKYIIKQKWKYYDFKRAINFTRKVTCVSHATGNSMIVHVYSCSLCSVFKGKKQFYAKKLSVIQSLQ